MPSSRSASRCSAGADAVGETIGFIGLGVMGEPMCRNVAQRAGRPVVAYDLSPEPLARLSAHGVTAAGSAAAVMRAADIVMLVLPGGPQLEAVCRGAGGLLAHARAGQAVVDHGTSPVDLTRTLAGEFAALGVAYADAPIARTRQAAEAGTLSIMVGADAATMARIAPILRCCADEVTHCGAVGSGQVVKLMNNMVLFQTVVALSEALAIGRAAGVDGALLFDTLTKGSADSFALRNHAMKAILPDSFPERAFSTEYALKDLSYALDLAAQAGLAPKGAETARAYLNAAIEAGLGKLYWPALSRTIRSAT
jgi:3-hydroxyisobutyrate dehydrogenase-like beta-hydroxyacid dehydrogenase